MTTTTTTTTTTTIAAALVATLVAGAGAAGCAVCTVEADCAGSEFCLDGACVPAPPARVAFLGPRDPVGDTFEATIELGFRGGEATVTLVRAIDAPGEPCLPFPPVVRVVAGDVDAYVTRVLVLGGLPALGPAFSLSATVEVNGSVISARTDVSGPAVPDDVGGITIRAPGDDRTDTIVAPLLAVEVETSGPARAFIEPLSPSVAPPTPRRALVADGARQRGTLPALRGPQIVWIERTDASGDVRRCGHGLFGTAAAANDDEVEVMLFSRSVDGDNQLVELSTRFTGRAPGPVGEAFCDGRVTTDLGCRATAIGREGPTGVDGLLVAVSDGVLEVAAVPRVISGPVEVEVRVARGDVHLGHFGPLTIQPALAETWVAARIFLTGGAVDAVVGGSDGPGTGLPW